MRATLVAWLYRHWVPAAGFMAAALLCTVPALTRPWPLLLIFLHSPGYMLHQVEEHTGDRFRRYANATLFGGLEVLRPVDVLMINLPFVWGINLAAFYAALAWGPGAGLAAPCLMLVNSLAHIAPVFIKRAYNPGLVTAVALFVPLSIFTLVITPATLPEHEAGLAIALAIHAGIIVHAVHRFRALSSR